MAAEYLHIIPVLPLHRPLPWRISSEYDTKQEAACGDGPINATFNALEKATGIMASLHHYAITR
jgi:hypothetical protein